MVAARGQTQQREQWARWVSKLIPEATLDQLDGDDLSWSVELIEENANRYTHVIVGLSQCASSDSAGQDLLDSLMQAGLAVALLDDAETLPESEPAFDGLVFELTPSGVARRPGATWCPLAVDTSRWSRSTAEPPERARPVVLHLGANRVDHGADLQPILAELQEAGFIEYQRRNLRDADDLFDVLAEADIVLDQSSPTAYGPASCVAMAAEKIVLGLVDEATRRVVLEQTGLALPILDLTKDNAAEVVTNLVTDPDEARRIATSGRSFVEQVHDGRATAAALLKFISPHLLEEPRRPKTRGRVVMLVDNNVVPDSRVQKQARSAAEHGWDVVLLGHQRPGTKTNWKIGKARVRLVTVGDALKKRHHVRRSGRLRSPLAYSRRSMADYRRQLIRAQLAELRMDRAVLAADRSEQPTARTTARAAHLLSRRARLAAERRWVTVRAQKTERLASRRLEMSAPLDRMTTRFWQRIGGYRSWRRLDPGLWEWEIAYGPVIDRLKPDIIHANDFKMLGVGARAKLRAVAAGRSTKLVWDAHEFLPGIRPWSDHPRWHIAQLAHEREYAPHADAVVTVSVTLADLLMVEHGLAERPTVVLNAPEVRPTSKPTRSIRSTCGLSAEVPLLVYSGVAAPRRGLDTMVQVLPQLPDVHVAFVVASPKSAYVKELLARAAELAVADRVHLLPYVPVNQIVAFLSTADVGVIPIHHYPNHEIALITKFLEYSHARLPIVVSDVATMSAMVRETGQGEVFVAEDVQSFAAAVHKVLGDGASYRAAYDQPGLLQGWTWESAAEVLDQVYASMHPAPSATP